MKAIFSLIFLLLISIGVQAEGLSVAPVSEASQAKILEAWEYRSDAFMEQLAEYPVASAERGIIQAVYLNEAFKDAGYSFDKTFRAWLSKLGPAVVAYPELHRFGVSFGFVDAMIYLTEMGPETRHRILSSGVYSLETVDATYEMMPVSQKQEVDEYLEDFTLGSVKADSYEGCMDPASTECY